jgi:hypothetical protein
MLYSHAQQPDLAADAAVRLDRLEDMARQLAVCGGTKVIVNVLDHMQTRAAQSQSPPAHGAEGQTALEKEGQEMNGQRDEVRPLEP